MLPCGRPPDQSRRSSSWIKGRPILKDIAERLGEQLRTVARFGKTITYNDLAALVDLDMDDPVDAKELAGGIRAVSLSEHGAGRPLLSTLVVGLKTRRPGKGFFRLAQHLGRHDGFDDGTFFTHELRRVHEHWYPSSRAGVCSKSENRRYGSEQLSFSGFSFR